MKKSLLPLLVFCLALPAAQAWEGGPPAGGSWSRWERRAEYRPYLEQMRQILQPTADTPIGSLTPAQLRQLALDLSVPAQKILFIQRSRTASFVLPGSGQFLNRDPLDGTLFLISDLALTAGTLIGAYFLLPEDLQFRQLSYWSDSLTTITDRWTDHSLRDYAPSIGVMLGGALVKLALRGFSSSHAARLAERNVASGKISFQPRLLVPGFSFQGIGWEAPVHGRGMGLMGGVRY